MEGFEVVARILIGRVCGVSESIAPIVMIIEVSRSSAMSRSSRVKDFHRIEGSTPVTITRSFFIDGMDRPKICVPGHVISRCIESLTLTCGLLT